MSKLALSPSEKPSAPPPAVGPGLLGRGSKKVFDMVPRRGKTERSKTLMRRSVKKPLVLKAVSSQKMSRADAQPSRPSAIATKNGNLLAGDIRPGRIALAARVPKSFQVSKFGGTVRRKNAQSRPIEMVVAKAVSDIAPPILGRKPAPTSHTEPVPVAESSDIYKPALGRRIRRALRRKPFLFAAILMSIVILAGVGFAAYRNVPAVSIRVASNRSGVGAKLPAYQPSMFRLEMPITYSPGIVTITYRMADSDTSYQIIQRSSDLNSTTLLDTVVKTKGPYQTSEQNGRTIYIYEGNSATWIDGGVWHTVAGSKSLTSDQLLRIAESL